MLKNIMKRKLPCVPGFDFAGIVDQIGTEVKNFKVGDEVYGRIDTQKDEARGCYAE